MGYTLEGRMSTPSKTPARVCPYKILEIRKNAAKSEVQMAYRRLALLNHPRRYANANNDGTKDINHFQSGLKLRRKNSHRSQDGEDQLELKDNDAEQQEKEWKFLLLGAAFETLSDSTFRERYDAYIRMNSNPFNLEQSNSDILETSSNVGEDGIEKKGNYRKRSSKSSRCGRHFNDFLPTCSPNHSNPTNPTGASKYHTFQNQLKHYATYLDDIDDDDDTTIDTFFSHNTLDSHNTFVISNSSYEDPHLFGGPLYAMYKARNHAPFTNQYRLFNQMFYSDIFHTTTPSDEMKDKSLLSNTSTFNDEEDDLERWRLNFLSQRKQQEILNMKRSLKEKGSTISSSGTAVELNPSLNSSFNYPLDKQNGNQGMCSCGTITHSNLLYEDNDGEEDDIIRSKPSTIALSDIFDPEKNEQVKRTIRIKNGFKITKTETIKYNLKTNKTETAITVTKEEMDEEMEKQLKDLYREKESNNENRIRNKISIQQLENDQCNENRFDNSDMRKSKVEMMKRLNKLQNHSKQKKQPKNCLSSQSDVFQEINKILGACGQFIP